MPRGGYPSRAPIEQVDDRHEERGADDRPQDREGMSRHVEHERLRQLELMAEPRAEESADEAEDDGDETAAVCSAPDGSADRSANRRDDEEEDESGQCDHEPQRASRMPVQ